MDKRILSLDVFRGITIAGMIFVNCPGNDDGYLFLQHAPWHGWTLADLVFPSFLIIMGVCLAISLGRRLDSGESRPKLLARAARRAAIIFSLGLLASFVEMSTTGVFRIPGVLQRIAVCDFCCAVLFLKTTPRTQVLTTIALLLGYWSLLRFVPVPGHGAGDLSPEGNLASYLDRLILGNHLFAPTHDPEGILSTLPAIATALMGVLAGHWLRSERRLAKRVGDCLAVGLITAAAGLIWGNYFPINKNLWTSSFALFTGGTALCGLGTCYWLVEVKSLRSWGRPFEIFGRNSLASYILSELFYGLQEFTRVRMADGSQGNLKLWICAKAFGWLSPANAALSYTVFYIALFLGLMDIFYRRKIFVKI